MICQIKVTGTKRRNLPLRKNVNDLFTQNERLIVQDRPRVNVVFLDSQFAVVDELEEAGQERRDGQLFHVSTCLDVTRFRTYANPEHEHAVD